MIPDLQGIVPHGNMSLVGILSRKEQINVQPKGLLQETAIFQESHDFNEKFAVLLFNFQGEHLAAVLQILLEGIKELAILE